MFFEVNILKRGDILEEKKSRYTPAQAKSAKKYLAKLADIKLRVTPEEKQEIEARAKAAGKSVNQFLKDLALTGQDRQA